MTYPGVGAPWSIVETPDREPPSTRKGVPPMDDGEKLKMGKVAMQTSGTLPRAAASEFTRDRFGTLVRQSAELENRVGRGDTDKPL